MPEGPLREVQSYVWRREIIFVLPASTWQELESRLFDWMDDPDTEELACGHEIPARRPYQKHRRCEACGREDAST